MENTPTLNKIFKQIADPFINYEHFRIEHARLVTPAFRLTRF